MNKEVRPLFYYNVDNVDDFLYTHEKKWKKERKYKHLSTYSTLLLLYILYIYIYSIYKGLCLLDNVDYCYVYIMSTLFVFWSIL